MMSIRTWIDEQRPAFLRSVRMLLVVFAAPVPAFRPLPILVTVVAEKVPAATRLRVPMPALPLEPLITVGTSPYPGLIVPLPSSRLPLIPFVALGSWYSGPQNKPANQN